MTCGLGHGEITGPRSDPVQESQPSSAVHPVGDTTLREASQLIAVAGAHAARASGSAANAAHPAPMRDRGGHPGSPREWAQTMPGLAGVVPPLFAFFAPAP
jgi:hypothetical protein